MLGGDNPVALPLILALEKKGFIIIASVTSPEAVDELERAGKGYVKALVLDPFEVRLCFARKLSHSSHIMMHDSLPRFRSSFAPWPLRYPIDSPSTSMGIRTPPRNASLRALRRLLLSLSQFSALAPLEHVQLQGEYLKYLNATHITPLQIIQALLPLMRNSPLTHARRHQKRQGEEEYRRMCSGGRRAHRAAFPWTKFHERDRHSSCCGRSPP